MTMRTSFATLALATLAMSCGGCSGQTLRQFSNEGMACLYPASNTTGIPSVPDDSGNSFAAGEAVNVAVQFRVCLSSSCSKDAMASCSVTRSGNTFRVVSSGSFVEHTGSGACTDDCGLLIARCSTEPLPAGSYRFEHGQTSRTLDVPYTMPSVCFGQF